MTQLSRAIRLPQATAIVVGIIIGASVFVQASEITAHVPTAPGVVLAWLLAGVLTLLGALVCAELASAFPRTGGVLHATETIPDFRAAVTRWWVSHVSSVLAARAGVAVQPTGSE